MKGETQVSLFRPGCKMNHIDIGGVEIAVEKKKIKNMYIRVVPPNGTVNLTAPWHTSEQTIYNFALSKIDGVKEKQRLYAAVVQHEYKSGETHYLWGKPYILRIADVEKEKNLRLKNAAAECTGEEIILRISGKSNRKQREDALNNFYRGELKKAIPDILEKSQRITGVSARKWNVRNMTTRWGTCNIRTAVICFNLQLAKKPVSCLEYIAIHELTHLLEKGHGARFKAYMDNFCFLWREIKKTLNEKVKVL